MSATLTASGSEQDSSTFVSRGPGSAPSSTVSGHAHSQRARPRSASTPRKSSSAERPVRTIHRDVTSAGNGHVSGAVHAHTHPHGHAHGHGHGHSRGAHGHPAPTSVLKSIMEQGGLVELKPSARPGSGGGIPTRAIGDPSTGTDTAGLGPPSPQDGDAEGVALAAQAGDVGVAGASASVGVGAVRASNHDRSGVQAGAAINTSDSSGGAGASTPASAPTVRPSYVELPKRPTFIGSTTATPLSVSSTSTLFAPAPSPIPASPAPPATPTAPGAQDPPLRVLVVDDDQLTRKLMKRMLQRLGCAVSTAENGQVAFDLITGEGRTPASEAGELGMGVAVAAGTNAGVGVGGAGSTSVDTGGGGTASTGLGAPAIATVPSEQDGGTPPAAERAPPQYDGPRYELIFLDNQMPVLSGLDLVGKLRHMGRTDFVVGVTGMLFVS